MNISIPDSCPSCGSSLKLVNSQLFCTDPTNCPAQSTKKLQHFCKVLKIKGFGEKTVEKLEITQLSDLLTLDVSYCESKGLGTKVAQNLVDQIQDRLNKKIYVSDFISAMSIPLVGVSLSRKLAGYNIDDITYDVIRKVGGGDKAATNLITWYSTVWLDGLSSDWDKYLIIDTIKEKTERVESKGSVCITGKLVDFTNRKQATEYLESLGWEVKSSVTKKIQYLICEDGSSSSSVKKAQQYGIEITTIKNLEDK
jgi:NAD-dependent DNA ligase